MTKPIAAFQRHPGRKVKPPALPAPDYQPGYFAELIYAHNWPPRFEPQFELGSRGWRDARTLLETRERQATSGVGWGSGTLVMPRTTKLKRPALMKGSGA